MWPPLGQPHSTFGVQVHAGYFVYIIHRNLAWTTGSLMCFLCSWRDSNPLSLDLQSNALTTELARQPFTPNCRWLISKTLIWWDNIKYFQKLTLFHLLWRGQSCILDKNKRSGATYLRFLRTDQCINTYTNTCSLSPVEFCGTRISCLGDRFLKPTWQLAVS